MKAVVICPNCAKRATLVTPNGEWFGSIRDNGMLYRTIGDSPIYTNIICDVCGEPANSGWAGEAYYIGR